MKRNGFLVVVGVLALTAGGFWVGTQTPATKQAEAALVAPALNNEKMGLVVFTDPGLDDTFANIALAKAAARGDVELLAVVTHYGCTTGENATRHGFRTFGGIVPKVPVIRGSNEPIEFPPETTLENLPHYYDVAGGKSHGLCGVELPALAGVAVDETGGVKRLAELIIASPTPTHLVALGPCTDVAKLLAEYPEAAAKVKAVTLMAGAFGFGNSGPSFLAEFNVYLDVKSCVTVLDWAKVNRVPTTIVPWDMPLVVWRNEVERLHSTDPWGKVCKEAMLKYFPVHGGDGIPGDPIAAVNKLDQCWYTTDPKVSLWLLKPELCLRLPTTMYVVTDRDAPKQFGRTVTERPSEAHSGPYAIHYVVPGQPELVRQELFRQLELKSK